MPSVAVFHQQYWDNDRHTNVITPPPTVSNGGYPVWQASVISGVAFGPPLDPLYRLGAFLRFLWAVVRMAWTVPVAQRGWYLDWLGHLGTVRPTDRAVYGHLRDLMTSDAWPAAKEAVRVTWTTQGFNDAALWKAMSVKVRSNPGEAARLFRHLHAVQALHTHGVTVPVADLHFLLEAAYQSWAATPKRTV